MKQIIFDAYIRKAGNSLAIFITKNTAEIHGLVEGSKVRVEIHKLEDEA